MFLCMHSTGLPLFFLCDTLHVLCDLRKRKGGKRKEILLFSLRFRDPYLAVGDTPILQLPLHLTGFRDARTRRGGEVLAKASLPRQLFCVVSWCFVNVLNAGVVLLWPPSLRTVLKEPSGCIMPRIARTETMWDDAGSNVKMHSPWRPWGVVMVALASLGLSTEDHVIWG